MSFIRFLQAILYGIVEGITEWLPVSSTGHLIILNQWFKINEIYGDSYWSFFEVVIQLGAILAVIVSFFKILWPFGKSKTNEEKKSTWILLLHIIIACLPAAIIGLIFEITDISSYLDNNVWIVAATLIIYGILFIVIEQFVNKDKEFKIKSVYDFTWRTALIIGLAQILALIPGTSRSGVTILSAMLIGVSRSESAKFSFLLSIPIMLGASLVKAYSFTKSGVTMNSEMVMFLIVGCVSAFVVSIITIKWLLKFINNHDFKSFGIYRIILGFILIILIIALNL